MKTIITVDFSFLFPTFPVLLPEFEWKLSPFSDTIYHSKHRKHLTNTTGTSGALATVPHTPLKTLIAKWRPWAMPSAPLRHIQLKATTTTTTTTTNKNRKSTSWPRYGTLFLWGVYRFVPRAASQQMKEEVLNVNRSISIRLHNEVVSI